MDLFDYFGLDLPKPVKNVTEGEAFEIADEVDPELLEESFKVTTGKESYPRIFTPILV